MGRGKYLVGSRLRIVLWMIFAVLSCHTIVAGQSNSKAGYRNPILFSDYSDPDVIRDGNHFYMVASSFHFVPGIPILESKDLVHWKILGHAVSRLEMDPRYDLEGSNGYAKGVWAPALRKHKNLFYIYFPTPTEGIFVTTAKSMAGPWSKPVAVIHQPGLEDPCPFWDDDGSAYMVHSKVGAGPLILHHMAADGMSVLDDGKEIVREPQDLPTLEGPKFYKRDGYYYIFAPFGGVEKGAQAVLRAKTIWGPYEHRVVLTQGSTAINGPHQGGYVETRDGRGWFIHFQSRGAHGRIVHLEPVQWQDGWPIIGKAATGEMFGEPVMEYPESPVRVSAKAQSIQPQTSDEFSSSKLGVQWEWNHNPDDTRWSLKQRRGFLRLIPDQANSFMEARNSLTQQMQDESLEFTIRLDISHMQDTVHAGLAMLDKSASGIQVVQDAGKRELQFFHLKDVVAGPELKGNTILLRVNVMGERVKYVYSLDEGHSYSDLGHEVPINFSFWKGSRPALFAYRTAGSDDGGFVDFDWVHYKSLPVQP